MTTYLKGLSLGSLFDVYRMNYRDIPQSVGREIRRMQEGEKRIVALFGKPVVNCDVLEIGPGQRSPFRYYFAARNRYLGIDIEPAQETGILAGFVDDLRNRGTTRALKTLGRRALGLDGRYDREMCRQLGIARAEGKILCMDAAKMTFADASMDNFVSTSVFEHLPEPARVMAEIARVLRPGGVVQIITHLYTSDSGIHDTRIFAGDRASIPLWSHLRPEHRHKVRSNSYLNEIRLADYKRDFDAHWPGAQHVLFGETPEKRAALQDLRAAGELSGFSDEELLADVLYTIWKK